MPLRTFSIVPGFFAQDGPDADITSIGAHPPRFGLEDGSPDRWTHFRKKISELNNAAPEGTSYKVLFLGRHGEGYHNVALAHYGREAWDDHYSKLNGDSTMTWGPDPPLTPLGEDQARAARLAWLEEVPRGLPAPERCFASPLRRALSTWTLTFQGDEILAGTSRRVTILEDLREAYGLHPCDMRSPRSVIERDFPSPVYVFEPGFSEEDLRYMPHAREPDEHVKARAIAVLDRVFQEDAVYISIIAHSGLLRFGFLTALGRAPHRLPTGGILPLVIKAVAVV